MTEATSRVERLKKAVLDVQPTLELDRARAITKVMRETEGEPMVLRRAQAFAAASRAATFLSQPEIILSAVTAKVDQERCAACLVCVKACPYDVPKINEDGASEIDEALCHGCGTCASECPAKAIELNWYEDNQIMSKLDSLLEGVL